VLQALHDTDHLSWFFFGVSGGKQTLRKKSIDIIKEEEKKSKRVIAKRRTNSCRSRVVKSAFKY
jgi:hypothetical protein